MLGSILGPDGMRGRTVVDLFAGSGALGIEALSRGASQVTFVERDPKALSAVRANLGAIGIDEARTAVHRGDVATWLAGAGRLTRFDVALCDPPYTSDCWPELWTGLRASLVVAESSEELVVPEPWRVHRRKRYGGTLVTVVTSGVTAEAVADGGGRTGAVAMARGMERGVR
jgi:16S rRNA (guanine966-N2)-methyltransferase